MLQLERNEVENETKKDDNEDKEKNESEVAFLIHWSTDKI